MKITGRTLPQMDAISRSGWKGAIRSRRGRKASVLLAATALGLICPPNDLSNAAADCQMPLPDKLEPTGRITKSRSSLSGNKTKSSRTVANLCAGCGCAGPSQQAQDAEPTADSRLTTVSLCLARNNSIKPL